MRKLIDIHKSLLNDIAHCCDISVYQFLWISWLSGLAIGYILGNCS